MCILRRLATQSGVQINHTSSVDLNENRKLCFVEIGGLDNVESQAIFRSSGRERSL